MVPANLVNPEGDAILLRCVLQFSDCDRDAVNQKKDISTIAEYRPLLPPLLSDLEQVILGFIEVDESYVSLAVLVRNEHRLLAAQPRMRLPVTFDVRLQEIQAAEDVWRAG